MLTQRHKETRELFKLLFIHMQDLLWQLAYQHSRAPHCAGVWGGTAGGSCCWACPGTEDSVTWAGQSAASSRAFWGGLGLCWWTCSRDTGTSGSKESRRGESKQGEKGAQCVWWPASPRKRSCSSRGKEWDSSNPCDHRHVMAPTSKCCHPPKPSWFSTSSTINSRRTINNKYLDD